MKPTTHRNGGVDALQTLRGLWCKKKKTNFLLVYVSEALFTYNWHAKPAVEKNLYMRPVKTKIYHDRPLQTCRTYPQDVTLGQSWSGGKKVPEPNCRLLHGCERTTNGKTTEVRRETHQRFLVAVWGARKLLHCCLVRKIDFFFRLLHSASCSLFVYVCGRPIQACMW